MKEQNRKCVQGLQSAYYLITGLWPIVHISSFMEISGYKNDLWLVKTVGVLVLCVAFTCVFDLYLRTFSPAVIFLCLSTAAGLLGIDLYYSLSGTISKIYLVDAFIQFLFIGTWVAYLVRIKR